MCPYTMATISNITFLVGELLSISFDQEGPLWGIAHSPALCVLASLLTLYISKFVRQLRSRVTDVHRPDLSEIFFDRNARVRAFLDVDGSVVLTCRNMMRTIVFWGYALCCFCSVSTIGVLVRVVDLGKVSGINTSVLNGSLHKIFPAAVALFIPMSLVLDQAKKRFAIERLSKVVHAIAQVGLMATVLLLPTMKFSSMFFYGILLSFSLFQVISFANFPIFSTYLFGIANAACISSLMVILMAVSIVLSTWAIDRIVADGVQPFDATRLSLAAVCGLGGLISLALARFEDAFDAEHSGVGWL